MNGTPLIVVMGVSGCGKTTVGLRLADLLRVPFADADSFHPEANIAKMGAGIPLDDDDRWPWLDVVGRRLGEACDSGEGIVMACSALKRTYRDALRGFAAGSVFFAHLDANRELLARRMRERRGHFMPPGLLDSQLAALEPLRADEPGVTVAVTGSAEETAAAIAAVLIG